MTMLLWLLALAPVQDRAFTEGADGKASLRYHDGLPVLRVQGSPEEIGAQYGKLAGPAIRRTWTEVGAAFLARIGGDAAKAKLRADLQPLEPTLPASLVAEMKAAAKASGLPYEDYYLFNLMFDAAHGAGRTFGCSTMAATGSAAADGPVMGRNFDLPPPFWGLKPLGLVVVRRPTGKHAFAAVTHPAFIGTHAGLNEKGLAVGATAGQPGNGYDRSGAPCMMLFRRVLEDCATAAEAEKLLRASKIDVATTLMVLDAKGGNFVAELSTRGNAFRRPADGVLYATNHFISPELAEKRSCDRLDLLRRDFDGRRGVGEPEIRRLLQGTGPGTNLQSMVFLPAKRSLAVSTGTVPAARGTFVPLDADVLFGGP
jgi:hypothetical protein